MSPNLSMATGFGLFRNSNLLTAHEHVANSSIEAYIRGVASIYARAPVRTAEI